MLVASIYGLVDGIFVGRYIGEAAFAAISLAMPFVVACFALGDLIGVGTAVPISLALGRGDRDEANNIFTCGCLLNVVCGLVCGLACILAAPALMSAMGATGELARQAATYLRVYAAFLPLTSVTYAADNYLRVCGKIRRSFFANTLLAVSGALIEFVLLGLLGFGVGASAFSCSVGMLICTLVSLAPFVRGGMDLAFVRPRLTWRLVRETVVNGGPAFLENIAGRLTSVILNVALLAQGGVDAVSIFGVLMYCEGVEVPITYGALDAIQPAVGFNYGAGNKDRVRALELCSYVAAAVIAFAFLAVVLLMPVQIVQGFMPEATGDFLDEAVYALKLFSLGFVIRWFPYATQYYLLAIGQPHSASLITVCQALIAPIIALVVLWPLGLTGFWLNVPVASALSAVLAAVMLYAFHRRS